MRLNAELLLLDRNSAFADVDLDAIGFLALLVELIANNSNNDSQRTDDDVKNIAIHVSGLPFEQHGKSRASVVISFGEIQFAVDLFHQCGNDFHTQSVRCRRIEFRWQARAIVGD